MNLHFQNEGKKIILNKNMAFNVEKCADKNKYLGINVRHLNLHKTLDSHFIILFNQAYLL